MFMQVFEQALESVSLWVYNCTITASWTILAVCIIRLLLKRFPKRYTCALWWVVGFRLVCAVSIPSVFSAFGWLFTRQEMAHLPYDIAYSPTPQVNLGLPGLDNWVNNMLPAPPTDGVTSANPMQIVLFALGILWLIGMLALLLWNLTRYLLLKQRLKTAVRVEKGVYLSEAAGTAFVLGMARPKIYLPYGLTEQNARYILAHERSHIARKDHIVKPLAFLLVCLHWFNPLVWLAFWLFCKDMEMACDERAVLTLGAECAPDYSRALVSQAHKGKKMGYMPLSFGEGNVKGRVKNALKTHKTAVWVSVILVIVVAAVVVAFALDPMGTSQSQQEDLPPDSSQASQAPVGGAEGPQTVQEYPAQPVREELLAYAGDRQSQDECQVFLHREGVITLALASSDARRAIAFLDALSLTPLQQGESAGYTFPYSVVVQVSLNREEDVYTLQTDGTVLYTSGGQTFAYKAQNPQAVEEYGEDLPYLSKQVFPLSSVLPFGADEVESLEISMTTGGEVQTLTGQEAREYAQELGGDMVLKPYEGENPSTGGITVYTYTLQNGETFTVRESYLVYFNDEEQPRYVNAVF